VKTFFIACDFAGSTELIDHISWKDAADIANEKLEREGVKVYGCKGGENDEMIWSSYRNGADEPIDTHVALLINIERLMPCEHKPSDVAGPYYSKCERCGIELKATWAPA
jgi:hypothetical protein